MSSRIIFLYLKGSYQANRFTPDSLAKGKGYFEQAIAMDPNYRPPHGVICGCFGKTGKIKGILIMESSQFIVALCLKAFYELYHKNR